MREVTTAGAIHTSLFPPVILKRSSITSRPRIYTSRKILWPQRLEQNPYIAFIFPTYQRSCCNAILFWNYLRIRRLHPGIPGIGSFAVHEAWELRSILAFVRDTARSSLLALILASLPVVSSTMPRIGGTITLAWRQRIDCSSLTHCCYTGPVSLVA